MKDDCLCITRDMRQKILDECHAPPYARHRGIATTTQALERYFYWPAIRKDIHKFVTECLTCQKVEYDRGNAPDLGLLMPHPVPQAPRESITMDFIFDLPKIGNDGIWTIIDRFSKQAHFITMQKTIKVDHMAKVFLAHILKHHGMPKSIVSDRDPRMTSLFWRALFDNKAEFSSSFHPQTNGQSEIANSTVLAVEMLCG